MAWVEKDHNDHLVSTPLLCGSSATRPGCPEPHPAWPWMPPGMGHPYSFPNSQGIFIYIPLRFTSREFTWYMYGVGSHLLSILYSMDIALKSVISFVAQWNNCVWSNRYRGIAFTSSLSQIFSQITVTMHCVCYRTKEVHVSSTCNS